ncbi:MAG: HD-GYP domain-containing protein [Solirubrobacteraceae bacterium]
MSSAADTDRLVMAFSGRSERLSGGERLAEMIVGGCCLAAAVALATTARPPSDVTRIVVYALAVAIAVNARFDLGAGFSVPTQVVFVPMLFALPPAWAPLIVIVALELGTLPEVLRRRAPPRSLATVFGNATFAVGPAAVLVICSDHDPASRPVVLVLALAAQIVGNLVVDLVREQLRGGIPLSMLLAESWRAYLLDVALSPLGLLVALAAPGRPWVVLMVGPLFWVLIWLGHERTARIENLIELNNAYRGTALLLGDVVEADDGYTGSHCKEVVQLALAISDAIGLDATSRRKLEFGALLHDVGKIAIAKEIINKPGALDNEEWEIVKTHTIEGHRMLERVGGVMGEVGRIVRSHHERWDGHGYPDALAGEEIPIEARIIACCDAYNAMTTTRSYRKALPEEVARAEMQRNAGTQFDPQIVARLIGVLEQRRPSAEPAALPERSTDIAAAPATA